MSAPAYTLARWYVKEGREADFVKAWSGELAEYFSSLPGCRWGTLPQSTEDPRQFYSFGPWRLEALTAARRRRNPQGIEMARRSVHAAGQRCPRAQVGLDGAHARAAALDDQAPAQEAVRQRLEAVEAALSVQVAAVSAPAP